MIRSPLVAILPGPGLVARYGPAIVLIPDSGGGESALATALAQWASTSDTGTYHAPSTARDSDETAWELVGLLRSHASNTPAFGAVIQFGDRSLFLVRGPVRVLVDAPDASGRFELDGRSVTGWVDRIIPAPISRIAMTTRTHGDVNVGAPSALPSGMFAGSALVLTPAGPARPTPARPAPARPAQPRPAPPHTADPPPDERATVDVRPKRAAAPDDPDDITQRPTELLRNVQRPPAEATGVYHLTTRALQADDGTRVPLDRNYVFGRSPFRDPSVINGSASPIVVNDPDHLISRVQVHITVTGELVSLRDSGSANGTFIAAPGATNWIELGPQPVVLPQGWSLRLGRRVFTYLIAET